MASGASAPACLQISRARSARLTYTKSWKPKQRIAPCRLGEERAAEDFWVGAWFIWSRWCDLIMLFESELAACARQVGAGPHKQVVRVLDRAGIRAFIRASRTTSICSAWWPTLQPAEHLPLTDSLLANRHFAALDTLDALDAARGQLLCRPPGPPGPGLLGDTVLWVAAPDHETARTKAT